MVAGLAIVQLLPPFPGVPFGRHLLGVPLIALGAVLAVVAYVEWVRSQRALRRGEPLPRSVMPWILAATITGDRGHRRRRRCSLSAAAMTAAAGPSAGPGSPATTRRNATRAWPASAPRWPGCGPRSRSPPLGGTVLKANILTGADHPRDGPGRLAARPRFPQAAPARPSLPAVGATRLFLITVAIVAVSLLCPGVAIFGPADPGALRRH